MISKLISTAIIAMATGNAAAQQFATVISDPVESATDVYFNQKVSDPFRWLEDDRSEKTGQWVTEQNKATRAYFSRIHYRQKIADRLTEVFNYERYSVPFRKGDYIYYYKNSGLQPQSVLYREKYPASAPEVFLDPNSFSKDGTTSMAGINFSKDGSMVAYRISQGGSDWSSIIVMDAKNKRQLNDTLHNIKFSGATWRGNEGFYYSTYDKPKEGSLLAGKTNSHKVWWHQMGTTQSQDKLIYGDDSKPVRYMGAFLNEEEDMLFISAANSTYGNALYATDLRTAGMKWKTIASDMNFERNVVYADHNKIILHTDKNAPNGQLMVLMPATPEEQNGKVFLSEKQEPVSAGAGAGYIFANYLRDAVTQVNQYDLNGVLVRTVTLPGKGSAGGFGGEMDEKETWYSYTSYTEPPSIYKYDPATGKSTLYRRPNIKYDSERYESKQVFYTSKDGTKIPMIITHKKGLKLDGNNPCMLYGYGGFNVNLTPGFRTSNIVLMENDGIYAVPNIRGGGEYGEKWHEAGTKMKKQNVFDDFMAAADYLVNNRYTSREKLAISGGSNGGLLVGACMTQNPSMCKVAFPAVGVMDMLRYHTFTSGAGWASDYGTSADSEEMFQYLLKYSPYHNLKPAAYPATLVTTADHDDRVVPAHSFKFGAQLQQANTGSNPQLIRIETNAGHGAGKSTKQTIEEQADVWSFMFWNMGLKDIK